MNSALCSFSVNLKRFQDKKLKKKKKKNEGEGWDLEHRVKGTPGQEEVWLSHGTKRAGGKHEWSWKQGY